MRSKFWDRFFLGLGALLFGVMSYAMCVISYKIIVGLIVHWATDPWFMKMFGIIVTTLAILFIPLTAILTVMFLGWSINKDFFRIEGDKYDQVEMNFKEK